MVNLHRWLKRTSPHLLVAGSLVMTGLSGCRTAPYSAVEVEPAPTTYPAPLMVPEAVSETVTQTVPYTEPFAAPPETNENFDTELDGDLFLKPPAPPLAESVSSSGNGPRLPFPEIDKPDDSYDESLTDVTPASEPEFVASESENKVADADPLAESNLFPEDTPKGNGRSRSVTDEIVGVVEDATDPTSGAEAKPEFEKPAADPFQDSFEPIVADPEVPVPDPGTVEVTKPETGLTPVEPLRKADSAPENVTKVEVKEQLAKETSSLFPPTKIVLPRPQVNSEGAPQEEINEDDLPVTSPKADVEVPTQDLNDDASAALPVITPSTLAEKTKPSTLPSLPQLDAKNSIEPERKTTIDLPQPDQLASIVKSDGKLPTTDTAKSKSFTKPLFPTTPTEPVTLSQDAVSVVAEIWSPGDNVTFDNSGNAFVSHGKHISKVSLDGSVEPWATMGSPRGHVILSDGSHLVADAGQRAIVKLNQAGEQVRKVATRSDGNFLRAPNDLVADSIGGVYFTDPGYARISNPIGRIHYVAADGSVTIVAQHLAFPEGIALSADGSKLLVVESQNSRLIEFEIRSPGQVGPKQVIAELATSANDAEGFANGLLVDPTSGRLFVAYGDRRRVEMLSPEGKLLRSIKIGATVNGIAFKDGDFSRVFATGGARSDQKNAGQLFEIRIAE